MKTALLSMIFVVISGTVHAASITCTLQDIKNAGNRDSVTINVDRKLPDFVGSENGVEIGAEHFSYTIEFSGKKNALDLSVVFTENNHVQDEVSSGFWTVDLTRAQNNEILIQEPLSNGEGEDLMVFICKFQK